MKTLTGLMSASALILAVQALYCSSVISMPSWRALDLMAFHPVIRAKAHINTSIHHDRGSERYQNLQAKWIYLDMPKSAGLMISYVDGLFKMALE